MTFFKASCDLPKSQNKTAFLEKKGLAPSNTLAIPPKTKFADASELEKSPKKESQRGQLIFEYILLLVVVATVGMLLIQGLVGRGGIEEGEPGGIIVQKWMAIVNTVAQDMPDN